MKIIALQAENIKKLVAIEIRPDGNIVQITGKNGQGKTSVLDAIWWALYGLANVQGTPIRTGEKHAIIKLDLGDMVVTRSFTTKDGQGFTSSLTVENAKGVRFTAPQTMLDKLLGRLAFDPLAFARSDSREQFNALKVFVPDVDFDAIAAADQKDFDERTTLHRKARDHKGAAEEIDVPLDLTIQPVDLEALVNELEAAGKHNTDVETRRANRERMEIDEASKLNRAVQLEREAKKLREEAQEINRKLTTAPALPEQIDTVPIKDKISEAKSINEQVETLREKKLHESEHKRLNSEAKGITDRMNAREQEKRKKIAAADLPVKNITFGDGSILMNDVPFNQASDAEQLQASVRIAMALNPKLKVIRIRDGSLLDQDSMKLLAEIAEEQDYQVWVERVEESGKVGFVLEDGHIKREAQTTNDRPVEATI